MFIGYNIDSKAYILEDCVTRKIKFSHDVVFNEITPTMGFKTSALQDNEKGIGAMEVNQNSMLYNMLEKNGEAKATTQRSTLDFNLCFEGMGSQNGGNGGFNDNLQGVVNNQQLEGKMMNVDPSLTRNIITTRRWICWGWC